jgi:hypothetical protein
MAFLLCKFYRINFLQSFFFADSIDPQTSHSLQQLWLWLLFFLSLSNALDWQLVVCMLIFRKGTKLSSAFSRKESPAALISFNYSLYAQFLFFSTTQFLARLLLDWYFWLRNESWRNAENLVAEKSRNPPNGAELFPCVTSPCHFPPIFYCATLLLCTFFCSPTFASIALNILFVDRRAFCWPVTEVRTQFYAGEQFYARLQSGYPSNPFHFAVGIVLLCFVAAPRTFGLLTTHKNCCGCGGWLREPRTFVHVHIQSKKCSFMLHGSWQIYCIQLQSGSQAIHSILQFLLKLTILSHYFA